MGQMISASKVKLGSSILIDPLDERTAAVVLDVSKSQFTQMIEFTAIRDGVWMSIEVSKNQNVRIAR